MPVDVQHTAQRVNTLLLLLFAMCLPVSTSAVSILAILIVLCTVVEGAFRKKFAEIISNEVSVAVLVYLGLHVIGLLWSEDKGAGLQMLEKQWKLMLMPFFLVVLKAEHRRKVIFFFLIGLTGVMLATYLAWFDLFHYGGVTPDHPTRRLFHVVYNPLLALGFYLIMHEVLWGEYVPVTRLLLSITSLAMAMNMFITEGRAGQLAFFAMLGLLLFQYFKKNVVKAVVVMFLALPLLFAAGYQLSPTFHKRINMIGDEIGSFKENPNTSIGLRLLFWQNSWEIIKENPIIGVGTGDYKIAYSKVNKEKSPNMVATDNPHNQYVMVLSQFGIVGLLSLLAIFFLQIRKAFTVQDGFERMRLAFPLLFLLIMLTESYLIVYETGFAFSLFSAVLYKHEHF